MTEVTHAMQHMMAQHENNRAWFASLQETMEDHAKMIEETSKVSKFYALQQNIKLKEWTTNELDMVKAEAVTIKSDVVRGFEMIDANDQKTKTAIEENDAKIKTILEEVNSRVVETNQHLDTSLREDMKNEMRKIHDTIGEMAREGSGMAADVQMKMKVQQLEAKFIELQRLTEI